MSWTSNATTPQEFRQEVLSTIDNTLERLGNRKAKAPPRMAAEIQATMQELQQMRWFFHDIQFTKAPSDGT